nr:MAG TPA: hypothetical protein [Caudoviricetes sp.]DAS35811.1 MAG TPA: hypothetical protein [Caudoviricetes sp.]
MHVAEVLPPAIPVITKLHIYLILREDTSLCQEKTNVLKNCSNYTSQIGYQAI